MNEVLTEKFGGRVRVRCMSIVVRDSKILLISHSGLNQENVYWMPPGGGLEKDESVIDCVCRELYEETGLIALKSSYLSYYEFTNEVLHAVELFFSVKTKNNSAELGKDPELSENEQLINGFSWMNAMEILNLEEQLVHPFVKELALQIINR